MTKAPTGMMDPHQTSVRAIYTSYMLPLAKALLWSFMVTPVLCFWLLLAFGPRDVSVTALLAAPAVRQVIETIVVIVAGALFAVQA
jgi:hypothetical protein